MHSDFELLPGAVHIWHASLDISPEAETHYFENLNPEEQQKALRFRDPKHPTYYTAARGILRELLGQYTEQSPTQLEFAYQEKGKPYLPDSDIEFNLSHSHDYAVF